jgi:aspartate aminotransferase
MKPSQAIMSMPRSGIREIMELASKVEGTIHLEVGEPNFNTPQHVCEAAAKAASEGFTRYTPNAGIHPLREALVEKVRARNGIEADVGQIVVTAGAVAGLYSTMAALVDPGSEILLADPSWPNYGLMMQLQGIDPVHYPLTSENDLVPNAADIEPLITEQTRAIIHNSPGNPTGAITPRESLEELLDLAGEYDLWVFTDEVYDEMWFDEPPVAMGPLDRDGRVISFFSMSKTYAMTGWRVGYLVAPEGLSDVIIKAQEPITSCVNAPAQMAALAAITGSQECVAEMRQSYAKRRDQVVELLEDLDIPHVKPTGAFYLMVDVSPSGTQGMDFARRLVEERGVAVVPGTTFGPDSGRYVRVSLATATDLLLEGVRRLAGAIHDWGS